MPESKRGAGDAARQAASLLVLRARFVEPAERFERSREYPEAEVNSLLLSAHDDVALLRRYLVDAGVLTRAHGRYRRV